MFKDSLKRLRKKHGISQYTLASYLHVAQSTVGNWESGTREPDFAMIRKIADYFHVTIDALIGEEYQSTSLITEKEFPTLEEVLEHEGITDPKRKEMIKEMLDLMRKTESNEEIVNEFLKRMYNLKLGKQEEGSSVPRESMQ